MFGPQSCVAEQRAGGNAVAVVLNAVLLNPKSLGVLMPLSPQNMSNRPAMWTCLIFLINSIAC